MTTKRNRLFFSAMALAAIALPVMTAAARAHPAQQQRPLYGTLVVTPSRAGDTIVQSGQEKPTLWNKIPPPQEETAEEEKTEPEAETKTEAKDSQETAAGQEPQPQAKTDAGAGTKSQPTPPLSPFAEILQHALGKKENPGMQHFVVTPPDK